MLPMNALIRPLLAVALLAAAAFAPAMAQEVVGTLHVVDGTVMTSSGGEFKTATDDQKLHVGDRVMLSDNAKATFTYDNGLVLHYESPGVYTVTMAPAATQTGVAATGGSNFGTVATILGAALVGAAGLDSMGNVEPDRPVSH
jgi:opacity protein-like surface antigen